MLAILRLLAAFIADLFKSRRRLEAEILFLRGTAAAAGHPGFHRQVQIRTQHIRLSPEAHRAIRIERLRVTERAQRFEMDNCARATDQAGALLHPRAVQ